MSVDLSTRIVKQKPLVVALVFTGVIALLVAVSLQLYGEVGERQNTLASKAGGGPKIEWSIQHLQLAPVLGEAETVEVSFQAKKDIGLVEPWVVPELQPYISIDPPEPQTVRKGDVVPLTLTILVPSDDPHATLEGTIHIRQAIQPPKSLAKPLPVVLTITNSQTVTHPSAGYSLEIPASWNFLIDGRSGGSMELFPPDEPPSIDEGYAGDILVNAYPNPLLLPLADFYAQEGQLNLFEVATSWNVIPGLGDEAARFSHVPGLLPSTIIAVRLGGQIVEVTDFDVRHQTDGIFESVGTSIQIAN